MERSERSTSEVRPVSFGERFTSSAAFAALFRSGMDLVEETAAYLDGPGRVESKKLDRAAALTYATESMRLTTRLMQMASWLLLHRAVKEGELSMAQAAREKSKVKLSATEPGPADTLAGLPLALRDLIERSMQLLAQIKRLDATMHEPPAAAAAPVANQVTHQQGLLRAAFEDRA